MCGCPPGCFQGPERIHLNHADCVYVRKSFRRCLHARFAPFLSVARHAYSTGALNSAGTDLALLDSVDNLALLRAGLRDLNARRIAVPPL
jgi:hypothetical protein